MSGLAIAKRDVATSRLTDNLPIEIVRSALASLKASQAVAWVPCPQPVFPHILAAPRFAALQALHRYSEFTRAVEDFSEMITDFRRARHDKTIVLFESRLRRSVVDAWDVAGALLRSSGLAPGIYDVGRFSASYESRHAAIKNDC